MPKFKVRMLVDAYAVYEGEVEAESYQEALRLAGEKQDEIFDFQAQPEVQTFDDRHAEVEVDDLGFLDLETLSWSNVKENT